MSKIHASGRFLGAKTEFEITRESEKLVIKCLTENMSAKMQASVEKWLKRCIKTAKPVAGTYYPPENTLIAAYAGLQNGFFDDNKAEIQVKGELEPIPYRDGVVY